MEQFKRYAIYYTPRPGGFADRAAAWLGWDTEQGAVDHPRLAGVPQPLADLTATPRRYGFHGTIKPPFALAEGTDATALDQAVAALAGRLMPVHMPGLQMQQIGGFLALTPSGDPSGLMALAATVVESLDALRAPLTAADRARRKPDDLTARQRDLLDQWGYPYVMDEFRFHLTLTNDLAPDLAEAVLPVAQDWFGPVLPQPFRVEDLCLCAEAPDGRFHLIHRYALTG
jgi:putative phosphonate metabolism protein